MYVCVLGRSPTKSPPRCPEQSRSGPGRQKDKPVVCECSLSPAQLEQWATLASSPRKGHTALQPSHFL